MTSDLSELTFSDSISGVIILCSSRTPKVSSVAPKQSSSITSPKLSNDKQLSLVIPKI